MCLPIATRFHKLYFLPSSKTKTKTPFSSPYFKTKTKSKRIEFETKTKIKALDKFTYIVKLHPFYIVDD